LHTQTEKPKTHMLSRLFCFRCLIAVRIAIYCVWDLGCSQHECFVRDTFCEAERSQQEPTENEGSQQKPRDPVNRMLGRPGLAEGCSGGGLASSPPSAPPPASVDDPDPAAPPSGGGSGGGGATGVERGGGRRGVPNSTVCGSSMTGACSSVLFFMTGLGLGVRV